MYSFGISLYLLFCLLFNAVLNNGCLYLKSTGMCVVFGKDNICKLIMNKLKCKTTHSKHCELSVVSKARQRVIVKRPGISLPKVSFEPTHDGLAVMNF